MLQWDWFLREGVYVLNWWLLVTAAGLAVLPLCWRLLGGLPDRGVTLARAVGLLLVGFVFWLLASFGFLRNTPGGMILAWLIVLFVSLVAYFRLGPPLNLRAWWRDNARAILTAEILFALLFVGWAFYRAHQNDTFTTEKPMELMFISSIMRSETFPPNDAWMAGYSISYYYFGYVMSAMLSTLSGVSSTVGFSLTIALQFALTGLTAFGVVYNMVRSRAPLNADATRRPPQAALWAGVLGMSFVVLIGNFQLPLIEMPYQSRSMPTEYFAWWGTQSRLEAVREPENANPLAVRAPGEWSYWWWFRASRVLTDFELDGSLPPNYHAQPIDEFPAFSFLLADNHPHVLALPYAVLALGLALNLLLMGRRPQTAETLFYALVLGGLIFLNSWDGPIYMVLLVGAEALRRLLRRGRGRLTVDDWWHLIRFGGVLFVVALVAYLPFYIGFRSQASGVLPNLIYPTLFRHYFLMFGPLLLVVVPFVLLEGWRGMRARRMNWWFGLQVSLGILLALSAFMGFLVLVSSAIPQLRGTVADFVAQNGGWDVVLPQLLERRLSTALTALVMLGLLWLIVARLFPRGRALTEQENIVTYSPATGFALLMIAAGAVLSLVPEFFYLRDNFGTRINTIFKFYYQTWTLFSLAGAYAVFAWLAEREAHPARPVRLAFGGVLAVVLVLGLMYPVFGVHNRVFVEPLQTSLSERRVIPPGVDASAVQVQEGQRVEAGEPLIVSADGSVNVVSGRDGVVVRRGNTLYVRDLATLDGSTSMIGADDLAVVRCLAAHVADDDAVVAEAVRDSYNARYNRIASITGIPSVLGWENHERQWRGPTYNEVAGSRRDDIDALYSDLRWDLALEIIQRYDIDYIMFGETERNQYGDGGAAKFRDHLSVLCESGRSRVYQVGEDVALTAPR